MGRYSHFAIANNYFMPKADKSLNSFKFSKGEVKQRSHYRMKTVGTETLDTTSNVSVEDCRDAEMRCRCA